MSDLEWQEQFCMQQLQDSISQGLNIALEWEVSRELLLEFLN